MITSIWAVVKIYFDDHGDWLKVLSRYNYIFIAPVLTVLAVSEKPLLSRGFLHSIKFNRELSFADQLGAPLCRVSFLLVDHPLCTQTEGFYGTLCFFLQVAYNLAKS